MNRITRRLAGALAAGLMAVSVGAEPAPANWQGLAPEVSEIANPFESLTEDQMDSLRQIVRLGWIDDAEETAEAEAL